jgi:hypothetical protein
MTSVRRSSSGSATRKKTRAATPSTARRPPTGARPPSSASSTRPSCTSGTSRASRARRSSTSAMGASPALATHRPTDAYGQPPCVPLLVLGYPVREVCGVSPGLLRYAIVSSASSRSCRWGQTRGPSVCKASGFGQVACVSIRVYAVQSRPTQTDTCDPSMYILAERRTHPDRPTRVAEGRRAPELRVRARRGRRRG